MVRMGWMGTRGVAAVMGGWVALGGMGVPVAAFPTEARPQVVAQAAASWRNPQQVRSVPIEQPTIIGDYLIALSPDGRLLAGGDRNSLTVWDVQTGQVRFTSPTFAILETGASLSSLVFSPDGRWLVASLYEGVARTGEITGTLRIEVWNTTTGENVNSFERGLLPQALPAAPGQPPTYPEWSQVVFSPDSRQIATIAGGNSEIDIRDLASGQILRTLQGGNGRAIAFSPDGRWLIRDQGTGMALPNQNRLLLWNLTQSNRRPRSLWVEDAVMGMAVNPNSEEVWVAHQDDRDATVYVRRWNLATARASDRLFAFPRSSLPTFSPNGTMLIAGSPTSALAIADLASGESLATVDTLLPWGAATAFSHDAQTFAVAYPRTRTIELWRPGL